MIQLTYDLSWHDDYIFIKVPKRNRGQVYVPGKTREQLLKDVLWLIRNFDVPVNDDRLRSQLDELIWNHVPKHQWY